MNILILVKKHIKIKRLKRTSNLIICANLRFLPNKPYLFIELQPLINKKNLINPNINKIHNIINDLFLHKFIGIINHNKKEITIIKQHEIS